MSDPPSEAKWSGRWLLAYAAVMLIACWVAFSGLGDELPLESHEALVARSAQVMVARGSMLVPHFNDQPRLKKPPLGYWLVIGVDALTGSTPPITEFESRLPSGIAGVLLVAMTMAIGSLALDRPTGLLGGLIVAASSGYVSYSHSARPEIVYAMFCTAAMLCFIASWRLHRTLATADAATVTGPSAVQSRVIPWLGWAMLGGAMLTKGPQIPIVLIAGTLLGLRSVGDWRSIRRILRPWSGLVIFAAVALWWYMAVLLTVPDAVALWRDELGDHLAGPGTAWWSIFNPYYLYRTAGLVMPWLVLYPLAMALPLIKSAWIRDGNRLLWWILVTAMVGMSLSMGRRWYYLLPMIAPLALLMASGGLAIGRLLWESAYRLPARLVLAMHGAAFTGAVLWLWRVQPMEYQPPMWGVAICVAAGAAAVVLAMTASSSVAMHRAWAAVVVAGAAFFAVAATNASLWGRTRRAHRDFSDRIQQFVLPHDPLVGWEDAWATTQYYVDRAIPEVDRPGELRDVVESAGTTWVLVHSDEPITLPKSVSATMVMSMACDGRDDALQLWRVSPKDGG